MKKTVFVLGANGFIGRQLCTRLYAAGYDVLAGVRNFPSSPLTCVTYQVADFVEPADFKRGSTDCEVIIHAASSSTVATNAANPRVEGNLSTTLALLEALQNKSQRSKLVFISSAGSLYRDDGRPASESDLPDPRSYHGASKYAAELFIKAWTQSENHAAAIIRPGNIFGPGQFARAGFALIPTAMTKIQLGETLSIWGDGSALRDYLYVDDFVEFLLCTVRMKEWPSWIVFNAGSGISHSTLEVVSLIENASGKQLPLSFESSREFDANDIRLDISLARSRLSWSPVTPFSQGIEKTWDWISGRQVQQ